MQHRYFKLYKPYGYVSQFITNDRHAKKKNFLGELGNFPDGTMAVGRLDEKTEGLLLLTTDGQFSYEITSAGTQKEYNIMVDGIITDDAIKQLTEGVEIGFEGTKYQTKKCEAYRIEDPKLPETSQKIRDARHGPISWISITLTEGKFRQVRKMTAAVGFPTLRLVRVRVGKYSIENMKAGDFIELMIP